MLKDKNIHRFESELKMVNRPGMDIPGTVAAFFEGR